MALDDKCNFELTLMQVIELHRDHPEVMQRVFEEAAKNQEKLVQVENAKGWTKFWHDTKLAWSKDYQARFGGARFVQQMQERFIGSPKAPAVVAEKTEKQAGLTTAAEQHQQLTQK